MFETVWTQGEPLTYRETWMGSDFIKASPCGWDEDGIYENLDALIADIMTRPDSYDVKGIITSIENGDEVLRVKYDREECSCQFDEQGEHVRTTCTDECGGWTEDIDYKYFEIIWGVK